MQQQIVSHKMIGCHMVCAKRLYDWSGCLNVAMKRNKIYFLLNAHDLVRNERVYMELKIKPFNYCTKKNK